MATPVETFIDEQLGPHLSPGETITHRAYLRVSRGPKRDASLIRSAATGFGMALGLGGSSIKRMKRNRGYFIALTATRLFLIQTRPGATGPALSNSWLGSWTPADVRISVDEEGLHIDTRDGHSFVLEIDLGTKYSATQPALLAALGA